MLKANFKELFEPVVNLIFTVFTLIFVRWMDSSRSLMAQVCLYRLILGLPIKCYFPNCCGVYTTLVSSVVKLVWSLIIISTLFLQEVAEFSTLLLRYKYYAFFDLNPKVGKTGFYKFFISK